MQLKITTLPIDKIVTPALVLGLMADNAPPQGAAGLADWRLGGLISREIAARRVCGEFGEACALPHPSLAGIELLLLYGLGEARTFSLDRAYKSGRNITRVMAELKRPVFALAIPEGGGIGLSARDLTAALLAGCLEGQKLAADTPVFFPTLVAPDQTAEEVHRGAIFFQRQNGLEGLLSLELIGRAS